MRTLALLYAFGVKIKAVLKKSVKTGFIVLSALSLLAPNIVLATANPPAGIWATGNSTNINLGWYDSSTNESFFRLERERQGMADWTIVTDQTSNTVGGTGGSIYYMDNSVTIGQCYNYRVSACASVSDCSSALMLGVTVATLGTTCGGGGAPSAPSSVTSALSGSTVNLTWPAVSDATHYYIQRSVNSGTYSYLSSPASASASDSSLTSGSTYVYQVQACKTNYGCSSYTTSNSVTYTPADTSPPTMPANFAGSAVSGSQINLSWSPSTDNIGVVAYMLYKNGTGINMGNSTSYSDTSVTAGTTYAYYVIAYDAAGNPSAQTATQTITPGASALVGHWKFDGNGNNEVSGNPNVQTVGTASFNTSGGKLNGYGYIPSQGNYFKVSHNNAYNLPTSFTIEFWFRQRANRSYRQDLIYKGTTGYYPSATVNFWIWRQLWDQYNFGPIQAAYVNNNTSYFVGVTNGNQLSHNQWHHVAYTKDSTGSEYYLDGASIYRNTDTAPARTNSADIIIGDTATDTDIDNLKIYNYALSASEISASISAAGGVPDATAPSMPSNLSATPYSSSQINLSWTASTDNVGVTGYQIYRNSAYVSSSATLSYSDMGLSPGTSYTYYVKAYDAANNYSSATASITMSTPSSGGSDASSPTMPTGLTGSINSASGVSLSWAASSDNIGVAGYQVYRNGTFLTTSTLASYTDGTVITAGTTNAYYVRAFDAAFNLSASSVSYSITAPSSGGTPTTPTVTPTTPTETAAEGAPATPSNLRLNGAASQGSVPLAWNDNSSNESFFMVEREISGSQTWVSLYQTGPNNTSTAYYTDNSAYSGVTYNYRVRACRSQYGCSVNTYLYSIATSGGGQDTSPPSAPANLSGYAYSSTLIQLSWTASTDNVGVTEYKLYKNGKFFASGNTTSYGDTSISLGTTYNYYTTARDAAGNESSPSSLIYVTVPATFTTSTAPYGVPAAPSNLRLYNPTAVGPGYGKVYLAWDDNSTDEDWFAVERMDKSAGGNWAPIGQTAFANVTTFNDTNNIVGGKLYIYRVQACRSGGRGCSNFTDKSLEVNIVPLATPADSPPSAPGNFSAIPSALGQVSLDWSAASDDRGISGYRIYRNGSLLFNNYALSFIDNNVKPGGNYTYYVVAYDASNNVSDPSNNVAVTIPLQISDEDTQSNGAIKGRVMDSSGNPISGAAIHFWNKDKDYHRTITADSASNYFVVLPPGDHLFAEIILPYSRDDLVKPAMIPFTLGASEKKELNFTIPLTTKSEKIIRGKVILPNGNPVNDVQVGAYSRLTGQWFDTVTKDGGTFEFHVGPGLWLVDIRPTDPEQNRWSWREQPKQVTFGPTPLQAMPTCPPVPVGQVAPACVSPAFGTEIKEVIFKVREAQTYLTVTLADEDDNPIEGAGVSIEPKTKAVASESNPQYKKSDSYGLATFWTSPGAYIIRSFLPPGTEYMNPDEKTIEIKDGDEQEVRLVFKNKSAAKAIIEGKATLAGGNPIAGAYVWAWSDKGGYTDLQTAEDGSFSIQSLSGDIWHLGAAKVEEGAPYRASEIIIPVKSGTVTVSLTLAKLSAAELPPPAEVSGAATDPLIATVKTGASVYIPPESAVSTEPVTLNMKPTLETPSRSNARVVGTAYDISVKDASGNEIKEFKNDLEVTLPYTDALLKNLGASEESVAPSYLDEATGAWVRVENYTIDKEKNRAILRVKHLTRFALVAPADTVPPAAPIKLALSVYKVGEVSLTWTNPSADFHHVKIYRSEKKNTLGKLVNDLVTNPAYIDVKLAKKVYHYSIKSVDAAGNESKKALTASVNAGRVNKKPPIKINKIPSGLNTGSRGAGVELLQKTLVTVGYLPSDFTINGLFDADTLEAVKSFQTESGLSPVGNVGPKTRDALNKLLK